jgi:putative ABC transport system ATP-binding protein
MVAGGVKQRCTAFGVWEYGMTEHVEAHPVLRVVDVVKDLPFGKEVIHILRGVDLTICAGERVAVVGPSGSGKSTLLSIMGGLDSPTGGQVFIDEVDVTHMNEGRLAEIRNEKIGFVFQFFNLIPTLTALENVALPIQFAVKSRRNPEKRARDLLALLGLEHRLKHRPNELSGGEQQRVAIARALANNPPLLLADEPTGNLDSTAGAVVLQALDDVQHETGTTIILVTHDSKVAQRMDRILTLVDGQLVDGNGAEE